MSLADIAIDSLVNPRCMSVKKKTIKDRSLGVTFVLGRTEALLHPIGAMLSYLVSRGLGQGLLFRFSDGRALTRPRLVELRKALVQVGINPDDYAEHSFCIGAATTAAACGVPMDIIKTLGQWRSDAYQLYIKLPREQLSNICKALALGKV